MSGKDIKKGAIGRSFFLSIFFIEILLCGFFDILFYIADVFA